MINYHTSLHTALNNILPTQYEMNITSNIKTPCISYMEFANSASKQGDTVGYSRIGYQVTVWANDIELIQKYSLEVDNALRPLGWVRVGCRELYDNQSTMIRKVMTYEVIAYELFE